jgi:predicted metal-dependent phosphoesterase TrpH
VESAATTTATETPTATTDGRPSDAPLHPTDAVDLHLHTLASDGFWTPAALIDRLVGEGIKVAAVCDHDTQRSVLEATRRGAKRGVRIVPGVEVTTRWRDRQWHLLVYGIRPDRVDEGAATFRGGMAELDARLMAAAEDARRRIEASGRALPSLEEITAGRPLWPFHVLSSVIREGHGKDLKTAAELVTELGGTFTADLPLARVVDAAHRAGGLCVVAHPGRSDSVGVMTEADLDAMLAEVPIDGLEAHYRSYTDEQTALYRDLAAARGLLISCGSDSHAPKQPVDPRPWRAAWCAELLGRLGIAVAPVPEGEPVWAPGMDPLAAPPTPLEAPKDAGQEEQAGEQIMEAEAGIEAAREGPGVATVIQG